MMSRKGNCWDNAVAESFLKQLNMNGYIDLNLTLTINFIGLLKITLVGIILEEYILV